VSDVPQPPGAPATPGRWGAAGRSSPVEVLLRGWFTALIRGGLAFAAMAALGQAAAFVVYLSRGAEGPVGPVAKFGWFYFGWFHHVSLVASLPDLSLGDLPEAGDPFSGGASLTFQAGLALMLGTFLAIGLLYGAGRAVADRAGGGGLARVLHGMKVVPVYAVPSFLISSVVRLDVPIPTNPLATGSVQVRSSAVQSFVLPLLIAVAAGAAGGLRSGRYELLAREPWGRRLAGALAGGFRMFLLGLVLSFAGLLVLAVVRPDATKAYFEAVSEPPADETAVIIGHHVLLLPNQSMWVLVPAMGGCDRVYGSGNSEPFLCYWNYPREVSVGDLSPENVFGGAPPVSTEFGTAPAGYFLFLLVPALSVLLGGRHAARRRARTQTEAAAVGAGSGVVFAVLVALGSWLASLSAGSSANLGVISTDALVRAGPDVLLGGLLALVWGVTGGLVGGWLAGRDLPARTQLVGSSGFGPSEEPSAAGPPDLPPPFPGEEG